MRIILIFAGLVALAAVAVAFYLFFGVQAPQLPQSAYDAPPPTSEDLSTANDAAVLGREMPTFDIVRVDRTGEAVIAGRTEPGETVRVYANGEVIGEAQADARGEWTMIVTAPLDQGDQEITLTSFDADGNEHTSTQVVVVAVPDRPDDLPLVVLSTQDGPSRVLQAPQDGVREGSLVLSSVDYDDDGNVIFAGEAENGAAVRAYVGDRSVGVVRAGPDGRWTIIADEPILPGLYTLRVDLIADDGVVLERIEVPFERASPADVALTDGRVIVQPGNSLWRISRVIYGQGQRYTIIYAANEDQIRDPDLIYPGQIFAVPPGN